MIRGLVELLWQVVCPVCGGDAARPAPVHAPCLARIARSTRAHRDRVPCFAHFEDGPDWFRLLHQWKYGGERGLARVVARCMASDPPDGLSGAVLVPVPDDPARRMARGFSPVADLAGHLGRMLRLPVDPTLVRRRRSVASQTGCRSDGDRRRNVRAAFRTGDLARWPARRALVLLDDQVTSGATVAELAPLLGARGAPVLVWCAARAARAPRGLS